MSLTAEPKDHKLGGLEIMKISSLSLPNSINLKLRHQKEYDPSEIQNTFIFPMLSF